MSQDVTLPPALRTAFRREADALEGVDLDVYRTYDRDPCEPIIGLGPRAAPLGFFGRDPGRREVEHGEPFVGSGGQKVRAELYRYRYGEALPDFQASLDVGRQYFWANTVPYKPRGNKAWSMAVKKRFQPLMAELLIDHWQGRTLITLGREAFLWFAIGQPRDIKRELEAFWAREDRFEAVHTTPLFLPDGRGGEFRLAPLPHPSPLNQTWFKRFPALLAARLAALDVPPES
ncbi:uracil-DNA glycosylase family protein [Chromohalobacter israelensis]|uniref:uracil-DNA glycosylase family protein n=1 Tax=Chromohalobacter israelensis TaxID=141390 RepID=UPI00054D2319|nr:MULTISPECIES: uracil-DNA glycosylase family protein [Chromohalobacter]MDF9434473.1 uracil-DNA glycosylase [Chromohalobacter israelensis]MDO0944120.1 uracil-DNA glycosylase family protein [Chromohalobacter salexigens]